MKTIRIIPFLVLGLLELKAQEKTIIITKEFAYNNSTIKVKLTSDLSSRSNFVFNILHEPDTSTSFSLTEMKSDVFIVKFYNAIISLGFPDSLTEESIKSKGKEVFDTFQNELGSETKPGPLAGRFTIEKEVLGFYLLSKGAHHDSVTRTELVDLSQNYIKQSGFWDDTTALRQISPDLGKVPASLTLFPTRIKPWKKFDNRFELLAKKFFIDSLQIEFNDSNLKNIKIVAHDSAHKVFIFHNPFPVAVSSFKEIQMLDGYVISNNLDHVIPLRNFMRYDPEVTLEGQDYSPDNEVYFFNFSKPTLPVFKENLSRVLDARIYTDFLGINKNNPNGLLQLEIGKKINRRAERIELYGRIRKSIYPKCGIIFNSYVYPYFNFTKIEQNNKYFGPVSKMDTINTVDLIRYGDLFGGAKLGLVAIEIPNSKTIFSIEVAPQVSRFNYSTLVKSDTVATDTLSQHDLVFSALVGLSARLLPDSRYGITFSAFANYMNLQSDRLLQSNHKSILGLSMEGFIKTGAELRNKLFFRMRYYTTFNDPNKTLLQLQFGWAFDIVKSKLN